MGHIESAFGNVYIHINHSNHKLCKLPNYTLIIVHDIKHNYQ